MAGCPSQAATATPYDLQQTLEEVRGPYLFKTPPNQGFTDS